jgi:hypothetical protein
VTDCSQRRVAHLEKLALTMVSAQHAHHLFRVEWSRTAATEDGELITAFIHGPIAIERF